MNEFRVSRSAFHPSECILTMLSTKPIVVPLHSIVRYLYEKLHVLSCTCNIYIDIKEYFYGLFELRVYLDTSV